MALEGQRARSLLEVSTAGDGTGEEAPSVQLRPADSSHTWSHDFSPGRRPFTESGGKVTGGEEETARCGKGEGERPWRPIWFIRNDR